MSQPNKTESERFKGPRKYLEYVLARGLVTMLQRLPIAWAYPIGRAVGWICWRLLKRRRAIVGKNLEVVNAWLAHDESRIKDRTAYEMPLEQQVREVFLRSGANLFSGFTFNRMSVEQLEKHIELEGLEQLKSALEEGKGAVILLAHMGPWEALAQLPGLARKHGIEAPFGAMYRPLNNTYLDDWYKSQREAQGSRLFSRRDGFHKPVDFIRAGGMLGMLSDQRMREGVRVPFMGREVTTMLLPGLFMRRAKAPMLSAALFKTGSCRWCVRFERVDFAADADLRDRVVCARRVNQALEHVLALSVADGFWFQKRFA